jgi:hypothetical protein
MYNRNKDIEKLTRFIKKSIIKIITGLGGAGENAIFKSFTESGDYDNNKF